MKKILFVLIFILSESVIASVSTDLTLSDPVASAGDGMRSESLDTSDIGNVVVGFINERAELEVYLWFIDSMYKRHCLKLDDSAVTDRKLLEQFCSISDIYTYSYSNRITLQELKASLLKDAKKIYVYYSVRLIPAELSEDLGKLFAVLYLLHEADDAYDMSDAKNTSVLDIIEYVKNSHEELRDKLNTECQDVQGQELEAVCVSNAYISLIKGFDHVFSTVEKAHARYEDIKALSRSKQKKYKTELSKIKADLKNRALNFKNDYAITELKYVIRKIKQADTTEKQIAALVDFNEYLVSVSGDNEHLENYFKLLKAVQYSYLGDYVSAFSEFSMTANKIQYEKINNSDEVDYDNFNVWDKQSDRLLSVLTLVARLSEAKSSEDLKEVVSVFVAPVGTWRSKLDNPSHWTLTSFFGISVNTEVADNNDETQFESIKGYVPIGLDLTWPIKVYKRDGNKDWYLSHKKSHGVFFQLLDFGSLVSVDLTKTDDDIESIDSSKEFVSPGIFYRNSFKDSPFVWGAGVTYTPYAWEINDEEVRTVAFKVFLAVDVTLLGF